MRVKVEARPTTGRIAGGPGDIQVTDLDSGANLSKVIRSLTIIMEPDDAVRAEAVLYLSEVDIDGAAMRYVMLDPGSETYRAVKQIEFDDGAVWKAPE